MALIVMADDGIAFDGASAERGPLGGAESAFVSLAEALAGRGHSVEARSNCRESLEHQGVQWAPLRSGLPEACDLYIGNRGHRVIGLVPGARRRLFWLHNPARYLSKPRNVVRLAWYRPTLIVTGQYHASTVPRWVPRSGCRIIPYGIPDGFRQETPREPPAPVAVFTSNPLRGLDWLLDLWAAQIAPALPEAQLHIHAGPAVYGAVGESRAAEMNAVLARAERMRDRGVFCFPPVGHNRLVDILRSARVMLYRGDPGETFCLALAEAQAMGVPAVVKPLGSVPERVADGASGCVAQSDQEFAQAAVAVLRDDSVWRRWHVGALEHQRGLSWDAVAARYEAMIG